MPIYRLYFGSKVVAAGGATTLTAAAGSYTLTGSSAALLLGHVAGSGTYALTGSDAALKLGHVAGAGSYALTGSSAALLLGHVAGSGSYSLTGSSAGFAFKQAGGAGAYTLTGSAATLALGHAAGAGAYTLTGSDAAFTTTGPTTFPAAAGSYTLTGTDAELALRQAADAGAYVLTGNYSSPPAVKTFYPLITFATAPDWFGVLQDGGTAPTAINSNFGWTVGTSAAEYWRARLGATARNSTVFSSTSFIDAATAPVKGTGQTATTAGDSFRTPNRYAGSFAAGDWQFDLGMRAVVAAGAIGRLRCRVWAGSNIDGTSARELTTSTLVSSIITLSALAVTYTTSVTWAAPAITLDNEYLFFQLEWNETTASGTANSAILFPRQGQSTITATVFTEVAETIFSFGQGTEAGAYTLTGADASFTTSSGDYTLSCGSGAYTLTGADAAFPGAEPIPPIEPPVEPPAAGGVGGVHRRRGALYRKFRLKKKYRDELEELFDRIQDLPPPEPAEAAPLSQPPSPSTSLLDGVAAPVLTKLQRAVDDEDDDEVALLLELIS